MLAYRAVARDPSAASPGPSFGTGSLDGPRNAHPLMLSLAPALDTAFGLEPAALFPEAILALIAEMEAGPLGPGARTTRPLEFA